MAVINLAGYSFHWVVEPGPELTVVAVSRNLGGSLVAFTRQGSLAGIAETDEIVALQLCDLDEDRVAEIITEETVGRGTGILTRALRVYRLIAGKPVKIWETLSLKRLTVRAEGSKQLGQEDQRAYIRCEPSGGGQRRARLLIITEKAQGGATITADRRAYTLVGDRIVEVTW